MFTVLGIGFDLAGAKGIHVGARLLLIPIHRGGNGLIDVFPGYPRPGLGHGDESAAVPAPDIASPGTGNDRIYVLTEIDSCKPEDKANCTFEHFL